MMYRIILSSELLEVLLEFHGHLFMLVCVLVCACVCVCVCICVCMCVCVVGAGGGCACVYGMICVQVQSMLATDVLEELPYTKIFENTFVVF